MFEFDSLKNDAVILWTFYKMADFSAIIAGREYEYVSNTSDISPLTECVKASSERCALLNIYTTHVMKMTRWEPLAHTVRLSQGANCISSNQKHVSFLDMINHMKFEVFSKPHEQMSSC